MEKTRIGHIPENLLKLNPAFTYNYAAGFCQLKNRKGSFSCGFFIIYFFFFVAAFLAVFLTAPFLTEDFFVSDWSSGFFTDG